MRAIAVDDDRAGADFGKFAALHQRAAERHGTRRFAAHADDGRGAFPQSEDAEQPHVWLALRVSWPPNSVAACSVEICACAAAAGNGAPDNVLSVMTQ